MPSKPNILIVGPSGSGKSTSLEKLITGPRSKEVALLDFERKGLPFLYDPAKLGYFREPEDIFQADAAMKEAWKADGIKIIINDSLSKYLDYVRDWAQSTKTGWDVWNVYNAKLNQYLEFYKKTGKVVVSTIHDEVVQMDTPEGGKVSRLRAFVQGKTYEGRLEKEFLIVLHTFPKKEQGEVKHFFATKTDVLNSAKVPVWLGLQPNIPNDLSVVIEKLYEKNLV
jgi:hypothetical protein